MSYTYQDRLRTSLSLAAPNGSPWTVHYAYDSARRLVRVSSPAGEFDYNYGWAEPAYWLSWYDPQTGQWESEPQTPTGGSLVHALSLPGGAAITNTFDGNARLLSTLLQNSGGTNLDAYTYAYNQAGQRTNVLRTAGDYVAYTYDAIGELTGATGREPSGAIRLAERLTYAYDGAGNLVQKTTFPTLAGQTAYGINALNEITNSAFGYNSPLTGWSGTLPVAGAAVAATNVTINGQNALLYGDGTFVRNWGLTNGVVNVLTAVAQDRYGRWATNTVAVTVNASNNAYAYDLNGNLLTDGTRQFVWDDENQLISVYVTNVWREDFVYDGKLRRRITRQYTWNGGWQLTKEVHDVYAGNVVVQERDQNNLPQVSYTRGNDLSGTLEGAGGIGGLLARTDNSKLNLSDPFATTVYHADGNGNVTALIYTNATMAAKYLYDPYGNTLAQSGPLAEANAYRYSSKEWDANAGLYYYLYRFYDPNLQRWPNRDPLMDFGSTVFDQIPKHLSLGVFQKEQRESNSLLSHRIWG